MPRYAVGSSPQVRVNQGNKRHLSTPRLADRKSVRENPDYTLRFGNGFRNKTLRNPAVQFDFIRSASAAPLVLRALNPQDWSGGKMIQFHASGSTGLP